MSVCVFIVNTVLLHSGRHGSEISVGAALLSSCLWILCLCGDSCSNSVSDAAAALPLRSVVSSSLWFHTSFSSLICNPPRPCAAIYSWPIYSHFDVADESGEGESENPISTVTFSIVARGGSCSRDIVICCCGCRITRMEALDSRTRWEPAWEQTTDFLSRGSLQDWSLLTIFTVLCLEEKKHFSLTKKTQLFQRRL